MGGVYVGENADRLEGEGLLREFEVKAEDRGERAFFQTREVLPQRGMASAPSSRTRRDCPRLRGSMMAPMAPAFGTFEGERFAGEIDYCGGRRCLWVRR